MLQGWGGCRVLCRTGPARPSSWWWRLLSRPGVTFISVMRTLAPASRHTPITIRVIASLPSNTWPELKCFQFQFSIEYAPNNFEWCYNKQPLLVVSDSRDRSDIAQSSWCHSVTVSRTHTDNNLTDTLTDSQSQMPPSPSNLTTYFTVNWIF